MSSLLELAERCESAAEPSDVLDGLIEAELHIAFDLDVSQFVDGVPIEWEADEDDGRVSIYIGKRKFKRYRAPAYTASLDAAMTLVPEGATTGVFTNFGDGGCKAFVGIEVCRAATPALALCAAALRARVSDTLPKGQDAKQGLAGTEGSAVAESETPPPSDLSTDKDG